MTTKYEILSALIDSQAEQHEDAVGWHYVLMGVMRDLQDNSTGVIADEELADAIYDRIATSTQVPSFDSTETAPPSPRAVN